MANTRQKRHPAAFKAKVALEAAKQTRTLAELSRGLPGPPGPDQPVEEATPRRRRIALRRRPPPRARREPGHPGRALRADRPAQHGGRVVEKKSCPLRLTSSGPWSNPSNPDLSIRRQCELLGLNRSSYYLVPATESEEDLRLMRLIDQQFLQDPVLRQPADDGVSGACRGDGQSQAGPAAHGGDGPGGRCSPGRGPPPRRRTRGSIPTCSAIGC